MSNEETSQASTSARESEEMRRELLTLMDQVYDLFYQFNPEMSDDDPTNEEILEMDNREMLLLLQKKFEVAVNSLYSERDVHEELMASNKELKEALAQETQKHEKTVNLINTNISQAQNRNKKLEIESKRALGSGDLIQKEEFEQAKHERHQKISGLIEEIQNSKTIFNNTNNEKASLEKANEEKQLELNEKMGMLQALEEKKMELENELMKLEARLVSKQKVLSAKLAKITEYEQVTSESAQKQRKLEMTLNQTFKEYQNSLNKNSHLLAAFEEQNAMKEEILQKLEEINDEMANVRRVNQRLEEEIEKLKNYPSKLQVEAQINSDLLIQYEVLMNQAKSMGVDLGEMEEPKDASQCSETPKESTQRSQRKAGEINKGRSNSGRNPQNGQIPFSNKRKVPSNGESGLKAREKAPENYEESEEERERNEGSPNEIKGQLGADLMDRANWSYDDQRLKNQNKGNEEGDEDEEEFFSKSTSFNPNREGKMELEEEDDDEYGSRESKREKI